MREELIFDNEILEELASIREEVFKFYEESIPEKNIGEIMVIKTP